MKQIRRKPQKPKPLIKGVLTRESPHTFRPEGACGVVFFQSLTLKDGGWESQDRAAAWFPLDCIDSFYSERWSTREYKRLFDDEAPKLGYCEEVEIEL